MYSPTVTNEPLIKVIFQPYFNYYKLIFAVEIYIKMYSETQQLYKLNAISLVLPGSNGISRTGPALCLEGVQHVGFSSSGVSFVSEDILQTSLLLRQPRMPKVVFDKVGKSREKDLRNHKISLPVQGT